ncbi:hypothetical protein BGX31_003856, partial [Mortierella sp. GBA43]
IKGARNFMEYFLFKVKPTIEPEDFKREGHVYLSLLIERIDHQRQINTVLDAARDKGEDVNWQKIEDTFYDVCLTEEEKANAMKELTTLGRRKGETWRGFAERVRIVARQNRALDNDLMLQPLTRSLPDDIQRHLQVWLKCEQRSIFKTVAEFCNCLQEVPGPTNLQEESSPTTLATSSTATYFCQICNINATHSTDGHKECSSCNRVGHSTEDCRSRSRQDSYQSNFRDDRRRRAYSPTRRNDRYRQQDNRREPYRDNRRRNDYRPTNGNDQNPFVSGSNSIHLNQPRLNSLSLVSRQMQETPVNARRDATRLRHILFHDSVIDTDNCITELEKDFQTLNILDGMTRSAEFISFDALGTEQSRKNRIRTSVTLDGHGYDALLDTGATHSFIDHYLAEQLQLYINPIGGCIHLGDKKAVAPRVGYTDDLEIECNSHVLLASFEVLDLLDYHFIIGMDLFHRLGFSIGGIDDGRHSATTLPTPTPDERPSVTPLETPPEELTPSFQQEKASFMRKIEHTLLANDRVPRDSHCPLPEME